MAHASLGAGPGCPNLAPGPQVVQQGAKNRPVGEPALGPRPAGPVDRPAGRWPVFDLIPGPAGRRTICGSRRSCGSVARLTLGVGGPQLASAYLVRARRLAALRRAAPVCPCGPVPAGVRIGGRARPWDPTGSTGSTRSRRAASRSQDEAERRDQALTQARSEHRPSIRSTTDHERSSGSQTDQKLHMDVWHPRPISCPFYRHALDLRTCRGVTTEDYETEAEHVIGAILANRLPVTGGAIGRRIGAAGDAERQVPVQRARVRSCAQCGLMFQGASVRARFCCALCRRVARNTARRAARSAARGPATCPVCEETYRPAHRAQRYCGPLCRNQARAVRVRAARATTALSGQLPRGDGGPANQVGGPRQWPDPSPMSRPVSVIDGSL